MLDSDKLPKADFPVLGHFPTSDFVHFGVGQDELSGFKDSFDMLNQLEFFVQSKLKGAGARFGYGSYLEVRSLYIIADHFNTGKVRNIHLGIDVWAEAGTPLYAPFDAIVHSHKYNDAPFDYGHCVVLECEDLYILMGHLSPSYLELIRQGDKIKAGTLIGHLGGPESNGGWVPHLHLQCIKDIGHYQGDYPGVCHKDDLSFYKMNCPDPTGLIGVN